MRGAPLLTGSIRSFLYGELIRQSHTHFAGEDFLSKRVFFFYMDRFESEKKSSQPRLSTDRSPAPFVIGSQFLKFFYVRYFLKFWFLIANCLYVSLCSRGTLSQHSGSAVESTSDKVFFNKIYSLQKRQNVD
jgi:hypothetical protein